MSRLFALGYGAALGLINHVLRMGFIALALSLPVNAEAPRIVMLGDSLTAGYGLPDGDGMVPQLQGWLDAQGVAAVIENAGVSGDTTAGGLARLDWALGNGADGLIVALGGNDLLRGLPPAEARANLSAILKRADRDRLPVLLIGLPAPGNWGPDYKAEWDRIYADLAAEFDATLIPNFLSGLGSDGTPASIAALMQADGLHPNRAGVARIVMAIGPQVADLARRAASSP